MRIEVGILKSKIITDNPKLLSQLIELYTFAVPGAYFSPAAKRGHWDGKKKFITPTGTFRSGLLNNIVRNLNKIGCKPDIKFNYLNTSINDCIPLIKNLEYRDYQKKIIKDALGKQRVIVKSPTGSGKSLIIAGIIKTLEPIKGVLLVNAVQLATQLYEFFTKDCKLNNIGICFGGNYIYGNIMICTVQSIEKILSTHLEESEILIVDEVHEFANGDVTLAAINSFPSANYRFGFTATVPKDKIAIHNLEGAFGEVLELVDVQDLIEDKFLAKPTINILPIEYEKEDYLSYREIYSKFIINNNFRNNKIRELVDNISKENNKAKILILVQNIEHGKQLETKIEGSRFIQGSDNISVRYGAIRFFTESTRPSTLISTRILQTGISIDSITHYINARGLLSDIATIQALGRSLRTTSEKCEVHVYDFLDSIRYLSQHSNRRIKAYKKEGHTVNILPKVTYVEN
jgi:superfamily II DNA or RNA helicase